MICRKCGAENNDDAMFCMKCGSDMKQDVENKKICPKCKSELEDGALFCNKCGHNLKEDLNLNVERCPHCGNELETGAAFCNKCGKALKASAGKSKSINKKLVLFIALLVVAVGVIGIVAYTAHKKAVEKAWYEEQVAREKERVELINSYTTKVGNLVSYIAACESDFRILDSMFEVSTGEKAGTGLLGPSFFVEYSKGLCGEQIGNEQNNKRKIDALYDEINELNCNEPEVEELKSATKNFYKAYEARYDLLVNCNFSISTYSTLSKSTKNELESTKTEVNQKLKEVNNKLENKDSNESEASNI